MKMQRKTLSNIAAGAGTGAATGGVPGAIIGAGAGLVNSYLENYSQKKADERARRFSDEQAEKAFNRQKYFDNMEKRWNSEAAQVNRMRDAGLNPNLLYGDLSASTVSTPSAPMAQAPNGVTRDYSVDSSAAAGAGIGLDSQLKRSVIDNNDQNTANQAEDVVGKKIENEFKEQGIINSLMEQIERINKLRADTAKAGAETTTIDALRNNLVEELNQKIKDSIQGRAESEQRVTESKQNVSKSKQDVTESKQRVTESKQRIEESKQNISESKSRELLNKATEQLRHIETKDLQLKYGIDSDQYAMINKYVHEHDLPAGSEKAIMQALENFAQATGKGIPEMTLEVIGSWLNARNWLDYISSNKRTDAIKGGNNQSEDGTFTPPSHTSQPRDTSSGLQPNSTAYERNYDKHYTPKEKRYIDNARVSYHDLSDENKKAYWKWVYDTKYTTQLERAHKIAQLLYKQTDGHHWWFGH